MHPRLLGDPAQLGGLGSHGATPTTGAYVNPTDRDQAGELERLVELGAAPVDVGQAAEVSWHVLADPEGNEFCLLRSRRPPT